MGARFLSPSNAVHAQTRKLRFAKDRSYTCWGTLHIARPLLIRLHSYFARRSGSTLCAAPPYPISLISLAADERHHGR